MLRFRPASNENKYSPAFSLKDVGTIFVCMGSEKEQEFYRVTKRTVNQSIYCIVSQSKHAPYTIKNNLPGIIIKAN
jgi:hypothetical protein